MAKRVAVSNLNASTIDILNVIRQNASLEYQSEIPTITSENDIPKVGQILMGYPALANQFLNALVNRIALVRVKSATFNNMYAPLKKGFLEYGETVEDIFVNIAKPILFSAEKAESRELKRYIPDVRSAFYAMNYRAMYPVSIEEQDLERAFLSIEGVQDLIARIVDSVYTAAEYDDFLLVKYLLIKTITKGKLYPVEFDATDYKEAATTFRGISNTLQFMSDKYNSYGVKNTTPRGRQVIFMDANYNAAYDVEVLAAAFHMEKAEFMGRLFLIDDFTTFDNDRFAAIAAEADCIEEVTSAELTLMANVKAIILDEDFFQIYDNLAKFTEKYIASGLRWNYFYHTWKTIAFSPFANAVVLLDDAATTTAVTSFDVVVTSVSKDANNTVVLLAVDEDPTVQSLDVNFVQDEDNTGDGVAVQPYGAVIIPNSVLADSGKVLIYAEIKGKMYVSTAQSIAGSDPAAYTEPKITSSTTVGDKFTFEPYVPA